ncbi:DUF7112 family protein [Halorientalis salina]|uniref:DUF7112 family protein n=1 Tax=Halorientalis salina TaxID=2932266 RepID=UPI0010AD0712|nr:hypothetical protein [Halorientalis salina]
MPERLPSDHDAIDTYRATVERVGRTDRRQVVVPDAAADAVPTDEIVELVFDEGTYHSHVDTDLDGTPVFKGAYRTPTLARSPGDGEDALGEWLGSTGVAVGDSVLLDVVTSGYTVGLRAPGERAIYEATEPPSESLSSIARDLDG